MPEWLIELLKLVGVFSSGGLVVAILKRKWEKSDRKDDVRAELEKIQKEISKIDVEILKLQKGINSLHD